MAYTVGSLPDFENHSLSLDLVIVFSPSEALRSWFFSAGPDSAT